MVNQIRKTTDISKKIWDQALKTPDLKLKTIQLKSNESKTAKSANQGEARGKANEWLLTNFLEILDQFRKFANWIFKLCSDKIQSVLFDFLSPLLLANRLHAVRNSAN